MPTLVLLRHGQSTWNLEKRFTGWVDVDLTPQGEAEATRGGDLLKQAGLEFDRAYASVLTRAIRTADLALARADQLWIPLAKSWRLNERHYGGLTGKTHAEVAATEGDEQVQTWRRSYDVPPPGGESLKDTLARTLPYYVQEILPCVLRGERTLVAAHGNSLRALAMVLDQMTPESVTTLEFATGAVVIYTLNADSTVASKDVVECAIPSSKPAAPR